MPQATREEFERYIRERLAAQGQDFDDLVDNHGFGIMPCRDCEYPERRGWIFTYTRLAHVLGTHNG